MLCMPRYIVVGSNYGTMSTDQVKYDPSNEEVDDTMFSIDDGEELPPPMAGPIEQSDSTDYDSDSSDCDTALAYKFECNMDEHDEFPNCGSFDEEEQKIFTDGLTWPKKNLMRKRVSEVKQTRSIQEEVDRDSMSKLVTVSEWMSLSKTRRMASSPVKSSVLIGQEIINATMAQVHVPKQVLGKSKELARTRRKRQDPGDFTYCGYKAYSTKVCIKKGYPDKAPCRGCNKEFNVLRITRRDGQMRTFYSPEFKIHCIEECKAYHGLSKSDMND